MRTLAVVATLALFAPLVAADAGSDSREVAGNMVLDPRCPGYAQPASVACFQPAGASAVRVVAKPAVGNAQPRMLVQLQNATVQYSVHWMCDDGTISWGGQNVTRVVVTLHGDRAGCADDRTPFITRGTLSATFS